MLRIVFSSAFLFLEVAVALYAAGPPEVVQTAKRATALVDVNSQEFGTAFCVHPAGFFVTNSHVVQSAAMGGDVTLVLDPSEGSQRTLKARIIRMDPQVDLALLLANANRTIRFTSLALGDSGALTETTAVTAFGYPFGTLVAERGEKYPAVTVSTGHVTSLRRFKGQLEDIQLDASLNPGNSGGPVLDHQGTIIGIVQAGVPGAALNFAIPVSRLAGFLDTQVIFDPPPLLYEKRHQPYTISVTVACFPETREPPTVEIELAAVGWPTRKYSLVRQGYSYRVDAPPLPDINKGLVRITATFPSGTVSGLTEDENVRVGMRDIRLSALSRIEPGGPMVVAADGADVSGAVSGLTLATIAMGAASIRVDLGRASRIDIVPAEPDPNGLGYTIRVSRGGGVVAVKSGMIGFGP